MEKGLVDQLGTLKETVRAAALRAELDPDRVKSIPLRFDPPKFGALSQFMRAGARDPVDMLVGLSGADGLHLQMVHSCPGEVLALEPSVLDSEAWTGWLSP